VFVHQNGLIRSKKVGDKRLAESVAARFRKKLLVGQLNLDGDEDNCPEFTAYAKHYLEDYAQTACKRNTWGGYESIVRLHLTPAWKGKKLNEISRADAKKLLLQKQQAGLSPKTVDNIKVLVSGIFTQACEEELLQANPALKLGKYIRKQDRKKHINPLTKEQASKFLATAQREAPEHYPLLLCAFRTGMRLGELIGLAWEDIDFDANGIRAL
jgi:integrase